MLIKFSTETYWPCTAKRLRIMEQQVDADFSIKNIFSNDAHFQLDGFINRQNCRIHKKNHQCFLINNCIYNVSLFSADFELEASLTFSSSKIWLTDNSVFVPNLQNLDVVSTRRCHVQYWPKNNSVTTWVISWSCNFSLWSCNLTPLDFFLWVFLKSKVHVIKPTPIHALKEETKRCTN